jgi:cytochrome c-type biogenesis protein CcmH
MGWLILLLLLAASLGALWWSGVRGGLLTAAAAALLLGGAGYAFFGNFTPAESWLRISEALARSGNTEDAVGILQNAVQRYPGDAQLWTGLGNALVDHAHGLTPPAEYAYRRAAELSPGYPAPTFFYGLALARSGDQQGAVELWKQLLTTAPPGASWRPLVEQGVAALSAPPRR